MARPSAGGGSHHRSAGLRTISQIDVPLGTSVGRNPDYEHEVRMLVHCSVIPEYTLLGTVDLLEERCGATSWREDTTI